jgi:O-antigen/teichoic acid export membrane protein
MIISLAVIILLLFFEYYLYRKDKRSFKIKIEEYIRLPIVIILIFMIVFLGKFAEIDFLYFKF